jgi:EAL domain-containing protein (putative c-di-GMP-specific phosphodiesterase class I)
MGFINSLTALAKDRRGNAASAENKERRFNTDDVSKQLLRVLQPLTVESLSLHDAAGELLWLNDGAFGPDERGVVLDALDVFALDDDREDVQLKIDDDRTALFACARGADSEVKGIAVAIVETPGEEDHAVKLSAPRVMTQMRRFAQLLAPPVPAAPGSPVTGSPATGASAAGSRATGAAPGPKPAAMEELSFEATSPSVETRRGDISRGETPAFESIVLETPQETPTVETPTVETPTVETPALESVVLETPQEATRVQTPRPAPARVPIERRAKPSAEQSPPTPAIHARRYARLRAGGAARHYEVKLAPDRSFAADLTLASRVAEHIRRSIERYTQTPSSFAIPLCADSVTRGGWIARLQPILTRLSLPAGLMGFSLSREIWQRQSQAAEVFIRECAQAGCFIVLDDFTLADSGLALLRSSAVKCLKIEANLTAAVINDKFAHATLAAILQAARVLGLYCVAKQVASSSQAKWLAAAGVEFADGVSRGVATAATKTGEVPVLKADSEQDDE